MSSKASQPRPPRLPRAPSPYSGNETDGDDAQYVRRSHNSSHRSSHYQRRYRHSPTQRSALANHNRRRHGSCSASPHTLSSWLGIRPRSSRQSRRHHPSFTSSDLTTESSDDGYRRVRHEPIVPITIVPAANSGSVHHLQEPLKGPLDYTAWAEDIKWIFVSSGLINYINGQIRCPDPFLDPQGAQNWAQNDAHACSLITRNIHPSQKVYTRGKESSHEMWVALQNVHKNCRHCTVINYLHTLFHCTAEGADIPKHLAIIKDCWEMINHLGSSQFTISNLFFKIILTSSLPPSWDGFTKTYIGDDTAFYNCNPKRAMLSQEFIGVIICEYNHQQGQAKKAASGNASGSLPLTESTNVASAQ